MALRLAHAVQRGRGMMDTMAAAHAVNGRLLGSPATFMRVTTDSRLIARDDLFVALKGERFDGHDFVPQALAAGAAGAVNAQIQSKRTREPHSYITNEQQSRPISFGKTRSASRPIGLRLALRGENARSVGARDYNCIRHFTSDSPSSRNGDRWSLPSNQSTFLESRWRARSIPCSVYSRAQRQRRFRC